MCVRGGLENISGCVAGRSHLWRPRPRPLPIRWAHHRWRCQDDGARGVMGVVMVVGERCGVVSQEVSQKMPN